MNIFWASPQPTEPNKGKRKFSSFFKSLVIELDKDLYGPDNHLVEWHRTPTTQETDGFQVRGVFWKGVKMHDHPLASYWQSCTSVLID